MSDYFHWVFGENILRDDSPTYLINLEHGISIRFQYGDSYFTTYEEFYKGVADVQFLTGQRPDAGELERLMIEAWNFLALFEQEEENPAEDLDDF